MSGVRRRAYVDLEALASTASHEAVVLSEVVADVRADAYGHGLLPVADTLAQLGVRRFLVSHREDAEAVRSAGWTACSASDENGAPSLGLELYGLHPVRQTPPVMRLEGEILAVKRVPAARGVSYGYTFRTVRPTTLVLVGLGYADGILRAASNTAPVRIGTRTATIAGRIAMDQLMVDVGDDAPQVGDPAMLFGDPEQDEPSVHEWARLLTVPATQITSRLGRRVERIHLP